MRVFTKVPSSNTKGGKELNPFNPTIIIVKKPQAGPRRVLSLKSDRASLRKHHLKIENKSRQSAREVINTARNNRGLVVPA